MSSEIDALGILVFLWRNKWRLAAGSAAAGAAGLAYCLMSMPLFYSQAVLTPKKSDGQGAKSSLISQLSGFGGMGGMVASQLGFGDNSLEKMEIVLKSREMADSVITRHDLLPVLFPERWDETKKSWRQGKNNMVPTKRQGIERLRSRVLAVSANPKKEILNVGAYFYDGEWSARIVGFYIDELNRRIRADVIRDADFNQDYLGDQMSKAVDPMLREKIQQLIALEVEKAMLVSSRSFSVLEKPTVPLAKDRPRTKVIVLISVFLGFVGTALLHYLAGLWREIGPELKRRNRLQSVRTKA